MAARGLFLSGARISTDFYVSLLLILIKMKKMTIPETVFLTNFRDIYLSYCRGMVRFACEYVGSREDAENIVHDAFAEVWEIKPGYLEKKYLLALLFTAIKNRCIDYLRHRIVVREAENLIQEAFRRDMQMKYDSLESFDHELLTRGETVEERVSRAIDCLPEKCRQIFVMNKLEGRKQKEIAQTLNISVNTVESQMSIAYKKLREELKDYLPLLAFFMNL
jgi:RNA polymerase sigma-70 factor (ECF subfamily)